MLTNGLRWIVRVYFEAYKDNGTESQLSNRGVSFIGNLITLAIWFWAWDAIYFSHPDTRLPLPFVILTLVLSIVLGGFLLWVVGIAAGSVILALVDIKKQMTRVKDVVRAWAYGEQKPRE